MAIAGRINLYDLGFRFYHDPNLHYEINEQSKIRINPSNGQAIMYFGMRDYLVEGVRTRKELKIVQGLPAFFLEPIDGTGNRNWDGVVSIQWSTDWSKHEFTSFNDAVSAPERISDHYSPETAVTNDSTEVRMALILGQDHDTRYLVKNADNGSVREVYAGQETKTILNKNEYIYGVKTTGDDLMKDMKSGIENKLKITITFDLAYDFTGQERGISFFTMPDTTVQVLEYAVN